MLINYESMFESEEKAKTRTAKPHTKNVAQKKQTKLYNCAEKRRWIGKFSRLEAVRWVQQSADVHMSSLRRHCVCFNQRWRQSPESAANVCNLAPEAREGETNGAKAKNGARQANQIKSQTKKKTLYISSVPTYTADWMGYVPLANWLHLVIAIISKKYIRYKVLGPDWN